MTGQQPPIVVGVDGSGMGADALQWAMTEAEFRGCEVRVVSVWRYFEPVHDGEPGTVLPAEGMAELSALIDKQVAAASRQHPHVRVRHLRLGGSAGPTLVDASREAAMLVVGSHGWTGTLPALLGSVSAHCVRRASCPVVIIRPPGRRRRADNAGADPVNGPMP